MYQVKNKRSTDMNGQNYLQNTRTLFTKKLEYKKL